MSFMKSLICPLWNHYAVIYGITSLSLMEIPFFPYTADVSPCSLEYCPVRLYMYCTVVCGGIGTDRGQRQNIGLAPHHSTLNSLSLSIFPPLSFFVLQWFFSLVLYNFNEMIYMLSLISFAANIYKEQYRQS